MSQKPNEWGSLFYQFHLTDSIGGKDELLSRLPLPGEAPPKRRGSAIPPGSLFVPAASEFINNEF